jgi:hypothetical protein
LYTRHPREHELEEIEQRIQAIHAEPSLKKNLASLLDGFSRCTLFRFQQRYLLFTFLVFLRSVFRLGSLFERAKETEAFTIGDGLPA